MDDNYAIFGLTCRTALVVAGHGHGQLFTALSQGQASLLEFGIWTKITTIFAMEPCRAAIDTPGISGVQVYSEDFHEGMTCRASPS